jgi:hypothetical protein
MRLRAWLVVALTGLCILLGTARVFAQQCEIEPGDPAAADTDVVDADTTASAEVARPPLVIRFTVDPLPTPGAQVPRLMRPRVPPRISKADVAMGSLYVSTVVLQALDVHSTIQGLNRGAVEMNPLMKDLVERRGLFIAAKALVGISTIMAAREVGKKNKVVAAIALVAINSAYGYVVNNNYRVARQLR